MSAKGSAAKSASGASMSKYDVEVEARLQALESKAHSKCDGGGISADVAAKIEELYSWYQSVKKKV
tara:strand:+ start:688 stop:885 length:198 start_codon:yes stop_codon:yes gene_type:complete